MKKNKNILLLLIVFMMMMASLEVAEVYPKTQQRPTIKIGAIGP